MRSNLGKPSVFSMLAFGIPLLLYLITSCPTVYYGDCGELALAAVNLEIAHPPGYPLLTNVGHVWSDIFFFLRPILALNFLSAIFAAFSALALYDIISSLVAYPTIISRWLALWSSFCFASCLTLWSVATSFEVYSLATLFVGAIIFSAMQFHLTDDKRYFYFSTFLFGLALCNHLSVISLGPMLVLLTWYQRKKLSGRDFVFCTALLVLPLTFYLYLNVRSQFDPVMDWQNPESFTGLKQQMLAQAYQRFVAAPRIADVWPYLRTTFGQFAVEFSVPWILLAIPGLYCQFRRDIRLFGLMIVVVAANIGLNFTYNIPDIAPYFLPTIFISVVWIAELLFWLAGQSRLLRYVAIATALLITGTSIGGNLTKSDISDRIGAEQYAKDLFDRVPANSYLFCASDNSMFPTLYLHYVENYRPDCRVYGVFPTLTRLARDLALDTAATWLYAPRLINRVVANSDQPVVFAREYMRVNEDFPAFVSGLKSSGLVYYVDSVLPEPTKLRLDWIHPPEFHDPKEALLYLTYYCAQTTEMDRGDRDSKETNLHQAVAICQKSNDVYLLSRLSGHLLTVNEFRQARKLVERALALSGVRHNDRVNLLTQLGTIDMRSGNTKSAREIFQKVLLDDQQNETARFNLLGLRAADLEQTRNLQGAIEAYREMTLIFPEDREITFRLGMLYRQIGDSASARQMFQLCDQSNYNRETVRRLLEQK